MGLRVVCLLALLRLSFTRIAPLWLGVALCGRHAIIKSILPCLEKLPDYPYTRPDIDAAAWTGQPQSFMHVSPDRSWLRDGEVSRADVWRLRHDCYSCYDDDAFRRMPPYGWPPHGYMLVEDLELEIRPHIHCSHQWEYVSWTWQPSGIVDSGLRASQPPTLPYTDGIFDENGGSNLPPSHERDDHASKVATAAIFQWSWAQVEKGFGSLIPSDVERGRPAPPAIDQWLKGIHAS